MPELEVDISFSYGNFEALRDVKFKAKKGELLAIIGLTDLENQLCSSA